MTTTQQRAIAHLQTDPSSIIPVEIQREMLKGRYYFFKNGTFYALPLPDEIGHHAHGWQPSGPNPESFEMTYRMGFRAGFNAGLDISDSIYEPSATCYRIGFADGAAARAARAGSQETAALQIGKIIEVCGVPVINFKPYSPLTAAIPDGTLLEAA